MRAEEVRSFLRDMPFRPFRVTMTSGRTFDIRHPEMLAFTRSTVLFFQVAEDGVADSWESFSLLLIESIKHLESTVLPPSNGQASA